MSTIVYPLAQSLADIAAKAAQAAYVGAKLHLYSNDFTPTNLTLLTDFTAAIYSGYTPRSITWSSAFFDQNNVPVVSGGETLFTMSGATGDQIYGAYLTDTAGTTLLWSARLDTAPFNFVKTGDTLAVTCQMSLQGGVFAESPGP